MNVLFIISTDDAETAYNAMRLANVAVKKGDEVSVFMLGKGVLFEQSSTEEFNNLDETCQLCPGALRKIPFPFFSIAYANAASPYWLILAHT
jgi:uncharacterized protein involved in oxidation of intracellular sulfur